VAWREHEWNKIRLQRLVYGEARGTYGLLAQYAIRAIAVVAASYKADKTCCHRNSSRTCPGCGSIAKANRPSQALFSCQSCGFAGHADVIAATVLRQRSRAVVMQPNVSAAVS
jgi:predicted RNA-binding Zn-ribbon protein involved in translation (DUF1610 family)